MTDEQKNQERQRIGQKIKEMRTEANVTLTELSEKTGLDKAHIWRIEAGKYNVGIDTLAVIAKALGREVDFVKP